MPQITVRTKNEQLYYSVAIATGINCLVLVSSRGVGKTVLHAKNIRIKFSDYNTQKNQ